jgi:hypothetical protein
LGVLRATLRSEQLRGDGLAGVDIMGNGNVFRVLRKGYPPDDKPMV